MHRCEWQAIQGAVKTMPVQEEHSTIPGNDVVINQIPGLNHVRDARRIL